MSYLNPLSDLMPSRLMAPRHRRMDPGLRTKPMTASPQPRRRRLVARLHWEHISVIGFSLALWAGLISGGLALVSTLTT